MTSPPPDGSRDRRIEDPTNLHLIHPLGRALLGPALAARVPANAVSVAGLLIGAAAAGAFAHWRDERFVVLGLALAVGWLVADGLDGMVARATNTASALGRFLDGVCDHGVFVLVYVALAASIGTAEAWVLAVTAGAMHAIQSSLYEGERRRYHRRVRGDDAGPGREHGGNLLVRLYDAVASGLDRVAAAFDDRLGRPGGDELARRYGELAAAPMRLQALLTANARIVVLTAACLAGDPRLFWWIEIGPMTLVAITGIAWHRSVEGRLLRDADHLTMRRDGVFRSEEHRG